MSPNRPDVSHLHFKVLVQLEKWDDAESELSAIEERGDALAVYLKGFMLKKKHLDQEACKLFQAAIDAGISSIPVYRDYADCLYRCGRFSDAKKNIELAPET